MNRRRFLTMLGLAPLAAKFAPVVEALAPAPAQFVVPPLADEVFKSTPIFIYLKFRQVGMTQLSKALLKNEFPDFPMTMVQRQVWKSGRGGQGVSPEN